MFTMNDKWILFSYSIPAVNAKARMRIWRRISASGAVQLKTGLQILPNRDDRLENITWLIGEVTALGGEALAIQCSRVEGMADSQIEHLFQAQIDPEFTQIQTEAREIMAAASQEQPPDWRKEQGVMCTQAAQTMRIPAGKGFLPLGRGSKDPCRPRHCRRKAQQPGGAGRSPTEVRPFRLPGSYLGDPSPSLY